MDSAKVVSFNHVPLSAEHDPALVESICPKCQRSLGTSQLPYMLRIVENAHKCSNDEEQS
jgi:hypothetical protein